MTSMHRRNSLLLNKIDNRSNLISPFLFQIFQNVNTITIYTISDHPHDKSYVFNLNYFLEIIKCSSSWKQIKIKARGARRYKSKDNKKEQLKYKYKYKDKVWQQYRIIPSWLYILWTSPLIQDIQSKYNQNKMEMLLHQGISDYSDGDSVNIDDCLIISRV